MGFAVLIVGTLVFLRFSDLSRVAALLTQAHPGWLLAALVAQIGTYVADAQSYSETLRTLRFRRIGWWELMRTSIIMEFLSDVAPSFGMSSNIYLVSLMRGRGLSLGASAIVLMIQAFTSFVAYALVLLAAAAYLLSTGQEESLSAKVTVAFVVLGSVIWAFIFIIFVRESWSKAAATAIGRAGRWLLKRWFPQAAVARFVSEVEQGRTYATQNWGRFLSIIAYKESRFLFDAVTAYFLFHSLGYPVAFGVVLVGFSVAMLLSTVSALPGGVGSFEVAMVLVYTTYGVPLEVAGVATLLFRAITFWLPLPVGLWLLRTVAGRPAVSSSRET